MNKPAPFSERQYQYFLRCLHSWFNVAEGGKRGGKNVLQTIIFCSLLETHQNKIHLVAGVSNATAKLNILDCDGYGLLNYFEGRCREGKYKDRDCVYVQTKTGEKVVLVSGGGKDGDEKLIKGNTYGMAYITEANECHPKFLKEVFDRTVSSSDRKIFHDLNPKEEEHWYYTDILQFHQDQQILHSDYGYNYGHFTLVDNMSMSDEKIKAVLLTYNKGTVWYRRDIKGDRAVAEGTIFQRFADNNARIKSKRAEYKEFCNACGVPEQTSRLRYECGTTDLKKTQAWRKYDKEVTIHSSDGIIILDKSNTKGKIQMIENIEQRHNGKGNANAISHFGTELNNRQKKLLEKLCSYDSKCIIDKRNVNMADLSALTAHTGVEYAMFTKKKQRLIIRGNEVSVNVSKAYAKELRLQGYRWSGHTHPGMDDFCLMPSGGDKEILNEFNQSCTAIYNSAGKWFILEKEVER